MKLATEITTQRRTALVIRTVDAEYGSGVRSGGAGAALIGGR